MISQLPMESYGVPLPYTPWNSNAIFHKVADLEEANLRLSVKSAVESAPNVTKIQGVSSNG